MVLRTFLFNYWNILYWEYNELTSRAIQLTRLTFLNMSKREFFFFKQHEKVNSAYGLIISTLNTYYLRTPFIQLNQWKKVAEVHKKTNNKVTLPWILLTLSAYIRSRREFNDKQNTRETRLCFQETQWRESDQMFNHINKLNTYLYEEVLSNDLVQL